MLLTVQVCNGTFGRDVMLQTVQGAKGPFGRDVILQCKGESGRCGIRDVTGERVHSGDT